MMRDGLVPHRRANSGGVRYWSGMRGPLPLIGVLLQPVDNPLAAVQDAPALPAMAQATISPGTRKRRGREAEHQPQVAIAVDRVGVNPRGGGVMWGGRVHARDLSRPAPGDTACERLILSDTQRVSRPQGWEPLGQVVTLE